MQVIFAVSDLQRSLDFYERVFAWPRNDAIDYAEYVELHLPGGGTLGLCERETFATLVGAEPVRIENGNVAPAYLYVRVDDAGAAAQRLEAVGGRPLAPLAARSWGEDAAWFADPDGNVVAVAHRSG
jgi:predicted enzyme related to lactoylglutathione lyase